MLNFRIIFRPISLLFCILLCCSTGIVFAQVPDIHGDTRPDATVLMPLNTTVSGTINSVDDADWFRIEIIGIARDVTIFTTGGQNTIGALYDHRNFPFVSDNDSGTENNFRISALLDPGRYFIEVQGLNIGSYVLHVEDSDIEVGVPEIGFSQPRIVVTEGTDDFATLSLDSNLLTTMPLTVNLLYTGDGNPNDNVGALTGELSSANTPDIETTVTVATNTNIKPTFKVIVIDDKIAAEFTRAVQVVLQSGNGYTVDPDNSKVELAVMDDDFAEIFFSQSGGAVVKGDTIVFTITKDLITDIDVAVEIIFTATGDFFRTTPMTTTVSFPEGGATGNTFKIAIPTVNDNDVGTEGSLKAEVNIIPGSPVRPGTPDERTVAILNASLFRIKVFLEGAQ